MNDKKIVAAFEERIEREIAGTSYRADQHEENEMVINSARVIEICFELLKSQREELEKEHTEMARKRYESECKLIEFKDEFVSFAKEISQKFIDKVDGGRARSVETYKDMKALNELAHKLDQKQKNQKECNCSPLDRGVKFCDVCRPVYDLLNGKKEEREELVKKIEGMGEKVEAGDHQSTKTNIEAIGYNRCLDDVIKTIQNNLQ